MKKKGRNTDFRCIYCGRYISYKDIEDKHIQMFFTPDTEFTREKNEMAHIKCLEKGL